jgi:pilus assembly protein Flp/PilA
MYELITRIVNPLRRLAGEIRGQDMIEYALMAGLLVLAAVAIMPNLVSGINTLFSEIRSVMSSASSQS